MSANIFVETYNRNLWGFGSGHGSSPTVTRAYRAYVESFIRENGVGSVVDFGCGDWQFSRFLNWGSAEYLGLDIHSALVRENQKRYGAPNIRFEVSPDRLADVPAADLLLVKDVLQHLPTPAIFEFMREVVPRFRFALITNCAHPARNCNREIEMGGFRPLDLRQEPFSFDVPVVFSFSGPKRFSFKRFMTYPAWHKLVLLFSYPHA